MTREELASFVDVDDATWQEFEQARVFSKGVPLSAFRSSHLNDDFYARAARTIWSEDHPDLLVLYLRAVDELSHFFYDAGAPNAAALGWSARDIGRFGGVVDRIYEWTDRAIAPLVDEALRDPNVLLAIVSDHGWEKEPDGRNNHNFAPPGILILAGAGVCRDGLSAARLADHLRRRADAARAPRPAALEGARRPSARCGVRGRRGPSRRSPRTAEPQNASRAVSSDADAQMREKLEALGYMRK